MGIRPGPRKARLSTDSLQQVPRGNFQRLRARRLARTSQGGSAQVRTSHQSEPIPSLAQQSVAFVLGGTTSGAVAMVSRAELRKLRVRAPVPARGGLSGRSLLLVTVAVIRVASANTAGAFFPPRKAADQRDFLAVTLSPSFSGHQMALWNHERAPSPALRA